MKLNERLNSTPGRILLALLAVSVALGAYLMISIRKEAHLIVPVEAIAEDALNRQAAHERDTVANVRSRNIVRVRGAGQSQCVELQNRAVGVASSYCYQVDGRRWSLVSERVGTR